MTVLQVIFISPWLIDKYDFSVDFVDINALVKPGIILLIATSIVALFVMIYFAEFMRVENEN